MTTWNMSARLAMYFKCILLCTLTFNSEVFLTLTKYFSCQQSQGWSQTEVTCIGARFLFCLIPSSFLHDLC